MNGLVSYDFLLSRLKCYYVSSVARQNKSFGLASHTSTKGTVWIISALVAMLMLPFVASSTVYTVSTKADLQTRMNAAIPGDTVIVLNGTYNWGQISFTNNNSTSTSNWIVLRAQSLNGVVFTGNTYLHFKGTRVEVNGFRFANGNAGSNAVISFRSSSSNLSHHSRVTNITVDNYNSDTETDNEWIGLYGTNNRVDHCTFINKSNIRATIVVWYSSTTYPNPSVSTYHRIDSNYFKGRSYMGSNGGETIRVGDSNTSRTDGYNVIEFNLFEDCIQTEPEIISNKSDYNIYRYNTFKNSKGGLTLRHGRYCNVYGNYFIVDNASVTQAYGIRVIDKGHKVFNNYFEGVNGNAGSFTSARAPITLYNGISSTNDTTDATKAAGYFPADSTIVAFNTIVNARGGAGIIIGYTDGGTNTFQPFGIKISNNVIKMSQGQAVLLSASNTSLTYSAEGNMFQAPAGLGITNNSGFTNATLNFGSRINGVLPPPALVQDAAVNTLDYTQYTNSIDAHGVARSSVFDAGAVELNGEGSVLYSPLTSSVVGAGTSSASVLPVELLLFKAVDVNSKVKLEWRLANANNFHSFDVEWSSGASFQKIGNIWFSNSPFYSFTHVQPITGKNNYRLKLIDIDGSFTYSEVVSANVKTNSSVSVFPNPATNMLHLRIPVESLPATLVLYDNVGRELKRQQLTSTNTNISTSAFADGQYYIKVVSKGNIIYHQMVIITP